MRDDRGKEVVILNRAAFEDWPLKGDERMVAMIQRLSVAVRGEGVFARVVLTWVTAVACMVVCVGCTVAVRMFWKGGPLWAGFAVGMVSAGVLGQLMFWRMRQWKSARLAAVVLEEGLCPCCGYNLHGIVDWVEGGEGVVACPECGSAWKPGRIKRTAAFAAGSVYGRPFRTIWQSGNRKNWTTRDANGRRVELMDPGLRKLIKVAAGERKEELRAARKRIARRSRWIRWPVLGVMWACSGLLVWVMAGVGGVWPPVIMGMMAGCVCLFGVFSNFLYSARAMREEMVGVGVCPSCGGELHGVGVEGRVGCAGCLGEWRKADVAHPAVSSAHEFEVAGISRDSG